ncbi:MAG: hypothetical protein HYX38_36295 [Rhodospirillales bacterium]|nr:hypothetical protein [Rhodospirillales bacterium]
MCGLLQRRPGQALMSLLLDEARTSRITIEGRIRALGFVPVSGAAGSAVTFSVFWRLMVRQKQIKLL